MRGNLTTIICSLAFLLISRWTFAATVAPSAIELSGSRGEMVPGTFTIINSQASEQEYFLGTLGFSAKDDSGAPQFFRSSPSQEDELPQWIMLPSSSIVVPAQSTGDVPFQVAIPDDIASGGYYAAITISPAPADVVAANGAILEAKTAILVFLTVEGETEESLALLDFTASGERFDLPFAIFRYRLQNQGNVHVKPEGALTLTGVFGQTMASLDANEAGGRVLPGSTRTFEVRPKSVPQSWYEIVSYQLRYLAIGPVIARLDLSYGDTGQTISSELTLWVFPWQLFVTIALLAGVIILPLRGRSKRGTSHHQ